MGIYDRDYMKAAPPQRGRPAAGPSWWQRIRFRLWMLFRSKKRSERTETPRR